MKKLKVVLVVVLLSILFSMSTGCLFGNSLIGEWGYLDGETMEFFEDGKVIIGGEQGEYLISDGSKLILIGETWGGGRTTETFEYEVKRNNLYLKMDNVVIELERLSSGSGSDSTPIIVAVVVIIVVVGALMVGVIAVIAGIVIYKKKSAKNA